VRVPRWIPLVAVGYVFVFAFSYAASHPLSAGSYGHAIYDDRRTAAVPAGSNFSILIGDGIAIPRRSMILVIASVENRQPGSNASVPAYFQLSHGELRFSESLSSGFEASFDTSFASSGGGDPQLHIRNEHPFDLSINVRSAVHVPPTLGEQVAMYSPALLPLLAAGVLWLVLPRFRDARKARSD